MASFGDVVQSVASSYAAPDDVKNALKVLGQDVSVEMLALPQLDRARMVDRFVRNLRVGVHGMVDVQRQLLDAVDARPESEFHTDLKDARSVLAVRTQLKEVLTVLGHGWESLARVQAAVCGLVRWLQTAGGGDFTILLNRKEAHFRVAADALGADARLIESSPIVRALEASVSELQVVERSDGLFLEFYIHGS